MDVLGVEGAASVANKLRESSPRRRLARLASLVGTDKPLRCHNRLTHLGASVPSTHPSISLSLSPSLRLLITLTHRLPRAPQVQLERLHIALPPDLQGREPRSSYPGIAVGQRLRQHLLKGCFRCLVEGHFRERPVGQGWRLREFICCGVWRRVFVMGGLWVGHGSSASVLLLISPVSPHAENDQQTIRDEASG